MKEKSKKKTFEPSECISIYVDGSFDNERQIYGYAFVAITPDGTKYADKGSGNNKDLAWSGSVAGELAATLGAVRFAMDSGYKCLDLYYDYEGVEKWSMGWWNAYKPSSIAYQEYMQDCMKDIVIRFHKVAAHTGVQFNVLADSLAKDAIRERILSEE